MNENIFTVFVEKNEIEQESIKAFMNDMKEIGVFIDIQSFSDTQNQVIIRYNPFQIHKIKTRLAGRREKYKSYEDPEIISLEEAENLIKTKGKNGAAKEFGIDASTLYRRIKKAKEKNQDYILK